jgi:hypothetical protein
MEELVCAAGRPDVAPDLAARCAVLISNNLHFDGFTKLIHALLAKREGLSPGVGVLVQSQLALNMWYQGHAGYRALLEENIARADGILRLLGAELLSNILSLSEGHAEAAPWLEMAWTEHRALPDPMPWIEANLLMADSLHSGSDIGRRLSKASEAYRLMTPYPEFPSYPRVMRILSLAFRVSCRFEEAIGMLRRIQEQGTLAWPSIQLFSSILFYQRSFPEALQVSEMLFERAVREGHRVQQCLAGFLQGKTLLALDRPEEAAKLFSSTISSGVGMFGPQRLLKFRAWLELSLRASGQKHAEQSTLEEGLASLGKGHTADPGGQLGEVLVYALLAESLGERAAAARVLAVATGRLSPYWEQHRSRIQAWVDAAAP